MTAIPHSLEFGMEEVSRLEREGVNTNDLPAGGKAVIEKAMAANLSTKSWPAQLLARWKYLLSFRKSDWKFEDYPVIVRRQGSAGAPWGSEVRFTSPLYIARLVNWTGLDGFGDTRAEAILNLRERFVEACSRRESKPRPGVEVPIQFAGQEGVAPHRDLAAEFTRDVLGMEWALITDESCLWHFALGGSLDEYYGKIMLFYGVDVRDVPDGNIAQILKRIAAAIPASH